MHLMHTVKQRPLCMCDAKFVASPLNNTYPAVHWRVALLALTPGPNIRCNVSFVDFNDLQTSIIPSGF